jgi:NAD(P)-dependent dehydrogenase (short-subunit alcohol dehydrogenase family)
LTRVAVVTGSAGGIGSATCRLLEAHGWDVIGLDRKGSDTARSLQIDIADAKALESALQGLERVDALVNNAAVQHFKPILETTVEEWDSVQAQNLRGAFVCMKALHAKLAESQGAIVNVSSVHAVATSESIAAYAASKGGLVALTRAAALEFASDGIRVNAVLPGAVDTPALRDGLARRADAEVTLIARTPLRRLGQPSDIAEAIAFLVDSERSAFVTGQTFVIDGGVLARLSTE